MSVAREMRLAASASGGEYCAVPITCVRTRLCCPPGSSLLHPGAGQGGEGRRRVEARGAEEGRGRCAEPRPQGEPSRTHAAEPRAGLGRAGQELGASAGRDAQAGHRLQDDVHFCAGCAAPEPKVGNQGPQPALPSRLEQHVAGLQSALGRRDK